jgi:hypothetical protein
MKDTLYLQIYNSAPDFKSRSEFQTEMAINKWRAVARKHQIRQLKDELLLQNPFLTIAYTNPEQRSKIVKSMWSLLSSFIKNFKP